jgi:hypothetical protein
MENLSTDVLLTILGSLIQRDIESLRLVSRRVSTKAKLRLRRIFLSPNQTNIDVFEGVINHPKYRLQVQEII